jgi:hypothetical protein
MRKRVTRETLHSFMGELAKAAESPGKVYFTGGATALLLGFREQTLDLDIKLDPEPKGAFEAIARLKNELDLNIELASPDNFIPPGPNWRWNSRHIATFGPLEFFHYDFALQALSKLERGYAQDLEDVTNFLRGGFVTPEELREKFTEIEPDLIRYPALEPVRFKFKIDNFLNAAPKT